MTLEHICHSVKHKIMVLHNASNKILHLLILPAVLAAILNFTQVNRGHTLFLRWIFDTYFPYLTAY